jgi:hypothetical protein
MGLWSDWYSKNAGKENSLVNAEWALKKIDEASGNSAPINATLNDAAESNTLPATASTPITTLLQTMRNNLKWLFNRTNCPFPVGFIYMSTSSDNPSAIYPGTTWVAWGSGRVPVSVDTNNNNFNVVEKTGGSTTHTLTINEMPSHNHKANGWGGVSSNLGNGDSYRNAMKDVVSSDLTTTNAGSSQAHNNLQPYITCYMFKRIT